MNHQIYIRRALELARRAGSATKANPQVGAVLVHKNRIIGEGYHMAYGKSHAEVNAVGSVKEQDRHLIKDSTIYVSLEPCCFVGKTPACTSLIINNEIKKVVISYTDKTPEVSGQGIKILRDKGIEVIENILEEEGRILAEPRNILADEKRPYVILKYALSQDGFLSREDQQIWLTNSFSKRLVHKWRSEVDAIMVGTNTAKVDDPELTNRLYFGSNPLRVVIDKEEKLSKDLKIFNQEAETILLTEEHSNASDESVISFEKGKLNWAHILTKLGEKNIKTLFVEGGAGLLNSIYESGLWDESRVFVSTSSLHKGLTINAPDDAIPYQELKIGNDKLVQSFKKR